jgi:hypothetical protein
MSGTEQAASRSVSPIVSSSPQLVARRRPSASSQPANIRIRTALGLQTEKGRRSVELDAGTLDALRAHKRRQAEERLAFGPGYEETDLLSRGDMGQQGDVPRARSRRHVGVRDDRERHHLRQSWSRIRTCAKAAPDAGSEAEDQPPAKTVLIEPPAQSSGMSS